MCATESKANSISRSQAISRLTAPGQPFEFEEVTVNGYRCRAFKNAPATLRDLFEQNRSDLPFFVYDDERYSYEDIYRTAAKIGALLTSEYGIRKGDRVAISMRNYPEWVTTFNAITSIGAIAVGMNALWQTDEIEYGLDDCGARVLFADQERLDRIANLKLTARVIAIRPNRPLPEGVALLADLIQDIPDTEMSDIDLGADNDVTILYTSGSTGHAKGAVSSHRNIISALLSWELDGSAAMLVRNFTPSPLKRQPATLLAVPLFHVTGLHAVLLASYRSQRRVVSMYKWDARQAAEVIEREKISSFVAPAAMTGDLVRVARESGRDLSTLMTVGGGGAPRAPEQVKHISETFANAMPGTGWGMTETNAIGTGIGGEEYLKRPGSSGRCAPVLDLRVVDETGNELPTGERGELQVRGTSLIRGYWNRPDANAEAFVDGWMKTGDVAYLDEEGFLFIVDRIKDMVIRGGENIGCGEVEAAFLEHPLVFEASVYGMPDERLGEELGATIFCAGQLDEDELRDFLSSRLARFKIPKYIRFSLEKLPRIAAGKILKRQLREEAIEALG